jgi:hypothetical protein
MVSYWLRGGLCGNQTFDDVPAALEYLRAQRHLWRSWSMFSFTEGLALGVLTPLELSPGDSPPSDS